MEKVNLNWGYNLYIHQDAKHWQVEVKPVNVSHLDVSLFFAWLFVSSDEPVQCCTRFFVMHHELIEGNGYETANIKGVNKDAKSYVGRFTTAHNYLCYCCEVTRLRSRLISVEYVTSLGFLRQYQLYFRDSDVCKFVCMYVYHRFCLDSK